MQPPFPWGPIFLGYGVSKLATREIFSMFFALAIGLAPSIACGSSNPFVHPGIINTNSTLEALTVPEKLRSNVDVLTANPTVAGGKSKLSGFSSDYQDAPLNIVKVIPGEEGPDEKRWRADMFAAYYNALRWAESGDTSHRKKAIEIMNGWARTFHDLKGSPSSGGKTWQDTEKVEASWAVPIWTNAAEIILHYKNPHVSDEPKWRDEDVNKFRIFLEKLHKEIGDPSCTSQKACWNRNLRVKENNQALSASLADMSLGVFNDNPELYEAGLSRIRYLLPRIIHFDGEIKELRKRDCTHPQYSLIVFTQAAQIEVNQSQGSTILSYKHSSNDAVPVLAKGLEYMARTLNNSGPNPTAELVRNCYNARSKSISKLRDGFAPMALRLYQKYEHINLPQLARALASGPTLRTGLFIDLTHITHGNSDKE